MGILGSLLGGGDEHHETPCDHRDDGGPSWVRKDYRGRPNPMGWGSDEPRTVKRAGADARSQNNRPTDHGSKAGKSLLSGKGALIKWSGDHVQVSGEKPKGRRR